MRSQSLFVYDEQFSYILNISKMIIILILLFVFCYSGLISNLNHNYISLSLSNPGLQSVYTFTCIIQSGLPSNGRIEIHFPPESYYSGLGVSSQWLKSTLNGIDVSANTNVSDRTVSIWPQNLLSANSTALIVLDSITNPDKEGGTGNFQIFTYDNNSQLIDLSQSFGTIGLSVLATNLTDLTMAAASLNAGDVTNYQFSFTNLIAITRPISIQIDFTTLYDFSQISSCSCSSLAMSWTNSSGVLILTGFSQLSKGFIVNCTIMGLTNPKYSVITSTIGVNIRKTGMNFITETGSVNPFTINPNFINVISWSNTSLYSNLQRVIMIDMIPVNPCQALSIVTPFFNIFLAIVEYGIYELTTYNLTVINNLIQIVNFTYVPTTTIRIRLQGYLWLQTGDIISNVVEVYSYLDNAFSFLVDYSNSSTGSRITPLPSVTVINTLTISSNNQFTFQNSSILIKLLTPATTIIDTIVIEIPSSFSNLQSCSINSTTYLCQIINQTIEITGLSLNLNATCGSLCLYLNLTLTNPDAASTYPININLYYNTAIVYYAQLSLTYTSSGLNNLSVVPFSSKGYIISFNIFNLPLAGSNTYTNTSYKQYTYISINTGSSMTAYACDFTSFSNSSNMLTNGLCSFNSTYVIIYGYSQPLNQSLITFAIYTNTTASTTFNISIYKNYLQGTYLMQSDIFAVSTLVETAVVTTNLVTVYYQGMFNISINATNAQYYLVQYPNAVTINGFIYLNNVAYSGYNLGNGYIISNNLTTTPIQINITNIYVGTGFIQNSVFTISSINNNSVIQKFSYTITAGAFVENSWSVALTNQTTNFPYQNYTFSFQISSANLDPNGFIDLIFSSAYNFLTYPPNINQFMNNYQYVASLPTLTINSSTNISLSNYPSLDINNTVSFSILGVRNPSLAGNYTISVNYRDSSNLIYRTASMNYSLISTYSAITNALSITCIPNSTVQAYLLQITVPFTYLPTLSVIQITLINVTLTNAYIQLDVYNSYTIVGNTITINFKDNLKMYTSYIAINIYQFNVTSSISASLTISYSGSIVYSQSTIVSISQNAFTTFSTTLDFYPQNSAELATYDWTATATQPLASQNSLFLVFGSQYSKTISPRSLSIESDSLYGPITYQIYDFSIYVTGFLSLSNNTFDISIFGIQNPNRKSINLTSPFAYYILDSTNTVIQKSIISGIQLTLPPQTLELSSIVSYNTLSRYVSGYSFTFYLDSIPSAILGGQILIDFPQQYILDSFGSCSTNVSFSLDSYCSLRGFRFTLHSNQQTSIYSQILLTVNISNIQNPMSQGNTSNFVILVYDSVNKVILSRTYGNMYTSYLASTYSGKQILVNNLLPIYLQKGVLSDPIIIQFNQPAQLPINLIPNVLSNQIIILPSLIQVQVGQTYYSIQIAASPNIYDTVLYLNWTKTNDNIKPIYMPLFRNQLIILQTLSKQTVNVAYPTFLYPNGTTFPYIICSSNAPYIELAITASINNTCSIVPSVLSNITLLIDCIEYSISCPLSVGSTPALLSLVNNQNSQYIFDNNNLVLSVLPYSDAIPSLNNLTISLVTRTAFTLNINSPSALKLYYVIADSGYLTPSFTTVYYQNSSDYNILWSNPTFGIIYITSGNQSMNISGLSAGHSYQLTFYIVSMFTVQNPVPIILTNTTLASEQSMQFTLGVNQSALLTSFQSEYLISMATILGIDSSRMVTNPCNSTLSSNNLTYWNIWLIANQSNSNYIISPYNLTLMLSNQLSNLQFYIPKLITNYFLFGVPQSAWSGYLVIVSPSYYSATLLIQNSSCFTIYYILTNVNITDTVNSSAYQISMGLNSTNQPTNISKSELIASNNFSIMISNLEQNSLYKLQAIVVIADLQFNISTIPTIVYFTTLRVKQVIDINSIFLFENIAVALLIILSLNL